MRKKFPFVFLLFLVIGVTTFLLFKNNRIPLSSSNKYTPLTQEIRTKILSYTSDNQMPQKIVTTLNQLNDPNITEGKKYELLANFGFYFSMEYSSSHDPSIRDFVSKKLGTFAKSNLGKYYKAYEFEIPCSDPTCGNKIDSKGKEIIDLISANEKINSDYKKIILDNLNTGLYIPDSELEDKQGAIDLTIKQLEKQNNKEASEAATLLKNYYFNRYHVSL